jgi:hypothetical protein
MNLKIDKNITIANKKADLDKVITHENKFGNINLAKHSLSNSKVHLVLYRLKNNLFP